MHVIGVVTYRHLTQSRLGSGVATLGADGEGPPVASVRRQSGRIEIDDREHFGEVPLHVGYEVVVEMQGLRLGDEHAFRFQAADRIGEELPCRQHLSRADRIGTVDDNQIILVISLLEELRSVRIGYAQPGIIERRSHSRQEPPAYLHHVRVELNKIDACHGLMLGYLSEAAAVTAADNEHTLR